MPLTETLNNPAYKKYFLFFLFLFLIAVKIPTLISDDMQPWDEGMYATRVLAIHEFGVFLDQSEYSVGEFYSASHPPLLIWIGYIFTLIFGTSAIVFKIIIFLFSLGCLWLIVNISQQVFDLRTGYIASMLFTVNILFHVFSKRFQFDIPYIFFILLSFYFFLKYTDNAKLRYLIFSGISFGLCLMVKIIVGVFIPLVILTFILISHKNIKIKFSHFLIFVLTGLAIALPWHIYMYMNFGNTFLEYFFGFHIFSRAFEGVEMNVKGSGIFYHINYLMSILPLAILLLFAFIRDFKNFKILSVKKLFIWVWFMTGLVIISFFRTKLEVYGFFILTPGVILISDYIFNYENKNKFFTSSVLFLLIVNIFWFATESLRPEFKNYLASDEKIIILIILFISVILIYSLCLLVSGKINLSKILIYSVIIYFFGFNLYYLFNPPEWDNNYILSNIKDKVFEKYDDTENLYYIGSNYKHNAQFSFYFNGDNLNWDKHKYDFLLMDTKYNRDITKFELSNTYKKTYLIVEKDGINRVDYPESSQFIPDNFKLILKNPGYELYSNF
ncbi:MAG TPA: glycosyltransferase family 39 protein [Ignavibacteria bacterium]|nr:glycosyltransferase family 39 protein [Ignavibacteria bacterium]